MTVSFYVQAATPDKQALQALFDNLDLLQQHQDLILSHPTRQRCFCLIYSDLFFVFGGIVAFVATHTMETRRYLFLLYNRKSSFR